MSKYHTTAIVSAINDYLAIREGKALLVEHLKAAFNIGKADACSREEGRKIVNQTAAKRYGVELNEKGNLPNALAGRRFADRLLVEVFDGAKANFSLEPTAEQIAAAVKLVRLCSGFKFKGLTEKQVQAKLIAAAVAAAK